MKKNGIALFLTSCLIATPAFSTNELQNLSHSNVSGDRSVVQLGLNNNVSVSDGTRVIQKEDGIELILKDVKNSTSKEQFHLGDLGNIQAKQRENDTVLYFKIDQNSKYNIVSQDNNLMLVFENTQRVVNEGSVETIDRVSPRSSVITDIDFKREGAKTAQINIDFKNDIQYETSKQDNVFKIVAYGSKLPSSLFRNVDVSDFDTPVERILSRVEDGDTIIEIFYKENREVKEMFTKVGDSLVLVSTEKKDDETINQFEGEYINMNFQQIPLKNTIQNLADKMDLNVLISEQVSGTLTLKLENVPHDEALDAILNAKDLGKEKQGNITFIAPKDEIHEKRKQHLESDKKIEELTPLDNLSWDIKYAKASDIASLVSEYSSERGRVFHDERTNRLMVQDVPSRLQRIQQAVNELDIPLQQVVVESRIVLAKRSEGESYGVGISGQKTDVGSSDRITLSGGGSNNNLVNLDLGNPTSSLGIGFLTDTTNLDLTLSAMEREGVAEVVSRPRIMTSDKKSAQIETGQEIPYSELGDSGIAGTSFKDVKLSLDVTPTITPNNKIMMELDISQDSLGQQTDSGFSIDTSSLKTEVLANDGETIVLGGIYKTDTTESTSGVPVLRSIPIMGSLFERTSTQEEEFELIIFITPKLFENEVMNYSP